MQDIMIEFYLLKRNLIIPHDYRIKLSRKNFLSSNSSIKIKHLLRKCYTENATVCVKYTNFYTVV